MSVTHSTVRRATPLAVAAVLLFSPLGHALDDGVGGRTEIVSLATSGAPATDTCSYPSVSDDGRYVVFETKAFDANSRTDVFLKDRELGVLLKLSRSSSGVPGNDSSYSPIISGDGRFVAFQSEASNLTPGDANGHVDVFRHDTQTGETVMVSVSSAGQQVDSSFYGQRVSISADGNLIAFASEATTLAPDSTDHLDIYVRNVQLGLTDLVSRNDAGLPADDTCLDPSLSSEGRFVTFRSIAGNLHPDAAGSHTHIYLRDLLLGKTELISVSSTGEPGFKHSLSSDISGDGRFVAFDSKASNLVPGDPNSDSDVFVRDRHLGTTALVSSDAGGQWGNGESSFPRISTDGNRVVFRSRATNLSPEDLNSTLSDVFLKELSTGEVDLVSVGTHGQQGNNHVDYIELAGLSSIIVFGSSDNGRLVIGDNNAQGDIFARDLDATWPQAYCYGRIHSAGCIPAISASGTPSATAGSGFDLRTSRATNGSWGLFCYSLTGPDDLGFFDGTMCLALPWVRTPVVLTNGSGPPGSNCSGELVMDFNAYIASGVDSGLVAGQTVWVQSVFRDSGSSFGFGMSDALVFLICP